MLKKMLTVPVVGLMLLGVNLQANAPVSCDELSGCKKKICNIEKELATAKKMDNSSKVDGLETSLDQVKKHCTDDKLDKKFEDKISDVQEDLAEHTKDYEQAVKDNKADKIEKYKAKMAEDNAEIEALQKKFITF